MKIVCISDTHNRIPKDLPEADVLVHAGDMTIQGTIGELFNVANWFKSIEHKYKKIIVVPGNHDIMFEDDYLHALTIFSTVKKFVCLINESIEIDGMLFYGFPQTIWFYDWAFNIKGDGMKKYSDGIPENTDVLITHEPPYGIGDMIELDHQDGHLGCKFLKDRIEKIQPRLHVFGHIHGGAGEYKLGRTHLVNAAQVNERYALVNKPILVEI